MDQPPLLMRKKSIFSQPSISTNCTFRSTNDTYSPVLLVCLPFLWLHDTEVILSCLVGMSLSKWAQLPCNVKFLLSRHNICLSKALLIWNSHLPPELAFPLWKPWRAWPSFQISIHASQSLIKFRIATLHMNTSKSPHSFCKIVGVCQSGVAVTCLSSLPNKGNKGTCKK